MKSTFPLLLLLICFSFFSNAQKLSSFKKFRTQVPEPSDLVYNKDYSKFYCVSDQGFLFMIDTAGKILKQSKRTGTDFEGVYVDDQYVYVTDERTRRILLYDIESLAYIKQYEVSYAGAANEGYEGMTFNKKKNCYLLSIEKNPTMLFELNKDFQKLAEIPIKSISDISSICYHNDFIYILSDEDEKVVKLDPSTYAIISSWKIPVTNPEGICFDAQGHLVIQSDKDQKIYKFNLAQLPK
jgi:uncharacterized protein YjiK